MSYHKRYISKNYVHIQKVVYRCMAVIDGSYFIYVVIIEKPAI